MTGTALRGRLSGARLHTGASGFALILAIAAAAPAAAGGKIHIINVKHSYETYAMAINEGGSIAGNYSYSTGGEHGFVRAPDGSITTFDPAGSHGTYAEDINRKGAIAGDYFDSSYNIHGFVRSL